MALLWIITRAFPCPFQQCHSTIEAVGKFSVRHGQEKRQNGTQMDGQQQAHAGCIPEDKQQKPAQADQEQKGDESQIHGLLLRVTMRGMALEVQPEQAGGTNDQANTDRGTKDDGQAEVVVGGDPAKHVVINSTCRGGGKTQQEAIKGQVMKPPSPQGVGIVFVGTALAMAAIKIT